MADQAARASSLSSWEAVTVSSGVLPGCQSSTSSFQADRGMTAGTSAIVVVTVVPLDRTVAYEPACAERTTNVSPAKSAWSASVRVGCGSRQVPLSMKAGRASTMTVASPGFNVTRTV